MSTCAPTFTRPNGKPYTPRKSALVAHAWEADGEEGVIIVGTLDREQAQVFAEQMCRYWYGSSGAEFSGAEWLRLGYTSGERSWVSDSERGRPTTIFQAVHH